MKKTVQLLFLMGALLCARVHAQNQSGNHSIARYHEVIPKEAVTQKGYLTTHRVKDRLYLEIPPSMLDRELLFIAHKKNPNYHQVKFVKINNKIQLRMEEIDSEAGNTIPLITEQGTFGNPRDKLNVTLVPAIFEILDINDKSPNYVIDVTDLFLRPPKPLSGKRAVIIDGEAHIEKVLALEHTIEVRTNGVIGSKHGDLKETVDYSLFLLPEPMSPRLFDYRMGFFTDKWEIGHKTERASIARWRLEKKYPEKRVSEPIKPIIFYYDPATPDKWKPYLKAGVEQWSKAFEAAGFNNAIVVKEPPVHDMDFSINSMRYSFIRWYDRTNYRGHEGGGTGNLTVIIDKRTGEILKGDIIIGAPYEYLADEYFFRCAALDKRALEYPYSDELMGALIERVTAHEAGHTFGLRDGNFGEYAYPFEKMRDIEWLRTMGHTPSVMNYARQNSVVQPEDNIPPVLLRSKVGPTDVYSIRWGYTPFPDIATPDGELPYLEQIVREQDTVPWYKFFAKARQGPDSNSEVVDCDNPIGVTALSIANLKRTIELIPEATQGERGHERKKRLYAKTLNHWVNLMKSVVSLVGGFTTRYKEGSQEGPVYDFNAVSVKEQREAVQFLNAHAFHAPIWMQSLEVTRKFEAVGSMAHISERQLKVLTGLLSIRRLKRLEEVELTLENGYGTADLLNDLHAGLWKELKGRTVVIDPYRQELQLAHIILLKNSIRSTIQDGNDQMSGGMYRSRTPYSLSTHTRSMLLQALTRIQGNIHKGLKKAKDKSVRAHLELCLLELEKTGK